MSPIGCGDAGSQSSHPFQCVGRAGWMNVPSVQPDWRQRPDRGTWRPRLRARDGSPGTATRAPRRGRARGGRIRRTAPASRSSSSCRVLRAELQSEPHHRPPARSGTWATSSRKARSRVSSDVRRRHVQRPGLHRRRVRDLPGSARPAPGRARDQEALGDQGAHVVQHGRRVAIEAFGDLLVGQRTRTGTSAGCAAAATLARARRSASVAKRRTGRDNGRRRPGRLAIRHYSRVTDWISPIGRAAWCAVSQPAPRSLIHHADFRRLWIGDTASQLGVALGGLAVPYLAVTALGASEFQMGLLSTLTSLGFLIIGLPSGALIDRRRKRTVMMVADVGRALLLATLAAGLVAGLADLRPGPGGGHRSRHADGLLRRLVPVVPAGAGTAGPGGRGQRKLQASQSVSQLAGPGIGGLLDQADRRRRG